MVQDAFGFSLSWRANETHSPTCPAAATCGTLGGCCLPVTSGNYLTFPVRHPSKFLFCTNMKNNTQDALESIFPGSFLNDCHRINLICDKFVSKKTLLLCKSYTARPRQRELPAGGAAVLTLVPPVCDGPAPATRCPSTTPPDRRAAGKSCSSRAHPSRERHLVPTALRVAGRQLQWFNTDLSFLCNATIC